ncbi:hypothetical protein [Pseudomonas fluorescens]|uniref:Uncharacterized protein n=1 Tax=Pseudomonas fluorescens TaxID=294 RepID=A0A5E7AJN8_PSEFL|nr:hypothetical protein [Pseudomonas fluorescens]VVN78695.1 hypothetical protein PS704_00919 [Pseudomonas fluorescens]
MHSELESQVWRLVQQACDATMFDALIQHAVDSFKRPPGFNPLVRLHASDVGQLGLQTLREVLHSRGVRSEATLERPDCLQLRSRLKDHIRWQLQEYLVRGGYSTEEMQEDQLGRDLGL